MKTPIALLLSALAIAALMAPAADALRVDPEVQAIIPELMDCHHGVGVQCPYQDCHDTTEPRCRDATCQVMLGYECYLDLPLP